jgi:cell shape-determining protein MreD
MKHAGILLLLGVVALIVQGALATILPPPFCPDLGLLVVLGIGLCWRGLTLGLCLAAFLGYMADLYSGSLMGQHALLRIFAFSSALLASRQLNLKGASPLMLFAAGLTIVYGLSSHWISTSFVESEALGWSGLGELGVHAVVNAVVSPVVLGIVTRVSAWSGGDETSGRTLRFDPLRRSA